MSFTTTTARAAAQQQTGMFDEPEAPEDFELTTPETSPAIDAATRHGAQFEQRGREWFAVARRRGRAAALASFASPTKTGAAALFLAYFNHKV